MKILQALWLTAVAMLTPIAAYAQGGTIDPEEPVICLPKFDMPPQIVTLAAETDKPLAGEIHKPLAEVNFPDFTWEPMNDQENRAFRGYLGWLTKRWRYRPAIRAVMRSQKSLAEANFPETWGRCFPPTIRVPIPAETEDYNFCGRTFHFIDCSKANLEEAKAVQRRIKEYEEMRERWASLIHGRF
jgi:hypothetical protein